MPKVRDGFVGLDEVKYDTSIYPRDKWNTSTINNYADSLKAGAEFPAIVLEEGTNRLLDGMHRWKAHQLYMDQYAERKSQLTLDGMQSEEWAEPTSQIAVEWHVIPNGIPAKLYAASFSTKHGDRISLAERKVIAREIFTENPDFTLELIAEFLDVSKSSAGDYVADIRARRKEAQKMVAYRLHRLGWTLDEIGEVINLSKSNVSKICSEFPDLEIQNKKLIDSGIPHLDVSERYNMPPILTWAIDLAGRTDEQRMERLGIKTQPYDVWQFAKCHDLFGSQHPGRIPGELVAHVLYFFTEPGAKVIDPMAGSGTTLDVCLAMGRECYAYDIDDRHERQDVIPHNIAVDGWPERVKKADLIFWDPPYFDKMDSTTIGSDGYIEGSISKLPRAEYMDFFGKRFSEAKAMVKKGTKLAFLMSDWDDNTNEREGIFIWDYADLIRAAGWKLVRQIQVPLSTQQVHPDIVNKFRKSRRLARLERYLLIAEA